MKTLTLIFFLVTVLLTPIAQASDFFAFESKNCHFKTKNGMLQGQFSQNYPNGEIMVEGFFDHNQRVGTWNFYNVNGRLIEKRLYFNNYEYAAMGKNGKSLKQFNADGQWSPIKERNVRFKQRIWKHITKENSGYHFEINKLVNTVNNNEVGAFYAEERFTKKIEKSKLKNIASIKIKEDWIYDNEREVMFNRTLGIGFVNDKGETVAWVYYPDCVSALKKVLTTWPDYHTNMTTLYDVFEQRAYQSKPYKKGKEKITYQSMIDIELEMIHMENMFIIAKT